VGEGSMIYCSLAGGWGKYGRSLRIVAAPVRASTFAATPSWREKYFAAAHDAFAQKLFEPCALPKHGTPCASLNWSWRASSMHAAQIPRRLSCDTSYLYMLSAASPPYNVTHQRNFITATASPPATPGVPLAKLTDILFANHELICDGVQIRQASVAVAAIWHHV